MKALKIEKIKNKREITVIKSANDAYVHRHHMKLILPFNMRSCQLELLQTSPSNLNSMGKQCIKTKSPTMSKHMECNIPPQICFSSNIAAVALVALLLTLYMMNHSTTGETARICHSINVDPCCVKLNINLIS